MVRFKMLFFVLLVCVGVKAQEVTTQEEIQKKKEINNIKLGEQAMYAEVVELASDDFEAISLAQQKTINKLQNNVIEACAHKMNITKEQAKEIFDIIDDKCQNVVIKKGDMVRVFAYIAKDAVGLSRKKAKQKDIDEIFGPEEDADSAMIASSTAQAMSLLMGTKDSIDNTLSQQTTAITAAATPTVAKVEVTQPVVASVPAPVATPVPEPVITPAPEPKVAPTPTPAVEIVVPKLCQTMIEQVNMKNLMRFLSQEKRYQKLMFGNSGAMQYPEKCYIVIIDKSTQHIVSVLDKGSPERMNFVSKKMDHYANYRNGNYAAVFVQEY